MNFEEVFKIAAAIIASLGGGALLIAVCANWLAGIWAKRMLQNERAKHSEKLESLKRELDLISQKDITRHYDKLALYRDVINLISEMLRELEAVSTGRQESIDPVVEKNFAVNRNKAYGYLSLVSSQAVMDRFNDMIDFFIPIIYEGNPGSWVEIREKADALLNEMRTDLGINEGEITYRGTR